MLTEYLNIIISALFGTTGIITLYLAKRERKAQASIIEANANVEMQKGYAQFVIDTNNLIAGLKAELQEVKNELKACQKQCKECSSNKIT